MGRKPVDLGEVDGEDLIRQQVGAMFDYLADIYGPEKLVLKAGKLGALKGMKSQNVLEQVVALQQVVFEDPTIDTTPSYYEIAEILEDCQEEIAEQIARQSIEQQIEDLVTRKMQEKHEEYLWDIRRNPFHRRDRRNGPPSSKQAS